MRRPWLASKDCWFEFSIFLHDLVGRGQRPRVHSAWALHTLAREEDVERETEELTKLLDVLFLALFVCVCVKNKKEVMLHSAIYIYFPPGPERRKKRDLCSIYVGHACTVHAQCK